MTSVPLAQAPHQSALPSRLSARQQMTLLWLVSLPMIIFLLFPFLALLLRVSPETLLTYLFQPQAAQAIALSIITTSTTLVLTLIFGTPVSYLLGRFDFRGRKLLDTLIDLP